VIAASSRCRTTVMRSPRAALKRLETDIRLQRAIERLWQFGPGPLARLFADMLDQANADPAVLDLLLKFDPEDVP
jgi:hypothetical protein